MTRPPGRSAGPATGTRVAAQLTGLLGELLITAGVLLGLFVVWQLWWTDVTAGAHQDRLVADLDWPTPAPAEADADPVGHREPAPVPAEPAHATTFAVLQVPRWGAEPQPISQGTSKADVLDVLGIGHYPGTAMPGGIGNFAVAGHRVTYGKPFNRVEELRVDDALVVRTEQTWYVYRVVATEVVDPSRTEVLAPVPGEPDASPTVAAMTMTTCHPMYSARERFIVHARLDYWLPVAEGTPVELAATDRSEPA